MIHKELIQIGLECDNQKAVISLLAGLLRNSGYVYDNFEEAVNKREQEFPTGLPADEVGIAIPHTDTCYVKESALAIGILAHPVKFGEMGNPDHIIDVDIVMMLAIHDPEIVVPFLQDICQLIQDRSLISRIRKSSKPDEVAELLNKKLIKSHA